MSTNEAPRQSPRLLERLVDAFTVLFCLILLGSHISWLDEPWDNSHCGVNSGAYYGYACKGIDKFGYFDSRMQGPLLFHPSGEGLFIPYTNHPGTIYAVIYPCYRFLGKDERALRLPMLFALIANLLILRFGLARFAGPLVGSLATLGFASLPMIFQFGKMVDIPMFCLAFFVPVVLAWLRYRREKTSASWWIFVGIAFIAGLLDWFCYFLCAAIFLDIVFSRVSIRSKLQLALKAGLPFGFAFALVFGWLLWADGGWDRLSETLEGLFRALGIRDPETETELFIAKVGWAEWWAAIRTNASYTLTIPFLVLSSVGLLAAVMVAELRTKILRPGLMLLVAGLLPCVVFRTHATMHEFWPLVSLAGFAFFFGVGVRALKDGADQLRLRGDLLLLLAALVVGALGVAEALEYRELRKGQHDQKRAAEDMNVEFTASDIVFTSDSLSPSRFYRNFVTVPQVTNSTFMRHTLRNIQPHKGQFKRAFLLWNKSTTADWQWLRAIPTVGELKEVSYGNSQYYQREFNIDGLWDY
ncbi:MAG: 4-amino-4-deoxy-L-arabinose transferase-like glycosyltransferase [Planctomycetota bacterium]|jgi:4-amino-4-deoxy-L-arabinose transferase-like glycosyltransferase